MDKITMIEWLHDLRSSTEGMELVKANFEDCDHPYVMTAADLIHEVIMALNNPDLISKQATMAAIEKKMDTVEKADVVLGLAAAMSVVKKMEGEQNEADD